MGATSEIWVTGRRKCAVARIKGCEGNGTIVVNGRPIEQYFTVEEHRGYLMQPFLLTGMRGKLNLNINVCGGGLAGQAGAVRHGIARLLEQFDANFRGVLKEAGMMTRDSRVKERKKPGQPGARKRFQFSKR